MEHKHRVAVMTWHHTNNYGTAFQAYAMCQNIKSLGYDVDIIDYRRFADPPLGLRSIRSLIKENLFRKKVVKKYNTNNCGFDNFYNEILTYTAHCKSFQDLERVAMEYDAVVCGSDQIWSPLALDERFYLDYVSANKIIAYAPSFGVNNIDNKHIRTRIKLLVDRFKHVSVREKTGCELLKNITGRDDIYKVLDPVLLIDQKNLTNIESISKENIDNSTPYGIIFFLKNNEQYFKDAFKILKRKNLRQLVLHSTQSGDNKYANCENPTPGDLLTLIKHSKYIITDSFHIMVLAIIYKIQFRVYLKDKKQNPHSQNNRIIDLLNELGLSNRIGNNSKREIDYNAVQENLNKLKIVSECYLKKALSDVISGKKNSNLDYTCFKCNSKICPMYSNEYFAFHKKNIKGFTALLLKRMDFWDFSLKEKCYYCANYDTSNKANYRKPLFYEELKENLKNRNIISIYLKYYAAYDIALLLRDTWKNHE